MEMDHHIKFHKLFLGRRKYKKIALINRMLDSLQINSESAATANKHSSNRNCTSVPATFLCFLLCL